MATKKKRWGWWIGGGVGALVLLVFLLLLFTPSLLSTSWGNRFLLSCINRHLDATLSAEEISLSWTRGQEVHKLLVKHPKGKTWLTLESGKTEAPLWTLLGWWGNNWGATHLDAPHLWIELGGDPEAHPLATLPVPQQAGFSCFPLCKGCWQKLSYPRGHFLFTEGWVQFSGAQLPTPLPLDWEGAVESSQEIRFSLSASQGTKPLLTAKGILAADRLAAEVKSQPLPTPLFEKLLPLSWQEELGPLSELMGPQVIFSAEGEGNPMEAKGHFSLQAPLLQGGGHLTWKEGLFSLQSEFLSTVEQSHGTLRINCNLSDLCTQEWPEWTLTGEALAQGLSPRWAGKQGATLLRQAEIQKLTFRKSWKGKIKDLEVTFLSAYLRFNGKVGYTERKGLHFLSPLSMQLTIPTALLPNLSSPPPIVQGQLNLTTAHLEEVPLSEWQGSGEFSITPFSLGGVASLQSGRGSLTLDGKRGRITSQGNLNLLTQGVTVPGKMQWNVALGRGRKAFLLNAQIHGEQIPTALAASLFQQEKLPLLMGPHFNFSLSSSIAEGKGPLDCRVESPLASMQFSGQIQPEGLTLRQPIQAKATLTPALGQEVLSILDPFFIDTARGENPITLTISPKEFWCPLPLQLSQCRIGAGELNLGKIWLANKGILHAFLALFKAPQLLERKEYLSWSTPVYFSLKEGMLQIARFDTLLGKRIHFAVWGKINLQDENVRMTLAVLPETLRQLLALTALKEKDALLIPIRGKLGDSRLQIERAAPQLAALLAQGQPLGGQLVQGVIKGIKGGKEGSSPLPLPTTQPFPWESQESP